MAPSPGAWTQRSIKTIEQNTQSSLLKRSIRRGSSSTPLPALLPPGDHSPQNPQWPALWAEFTRTSTTTTWYSRTVARPRGTRPTTRSARGPVHPAASSSLRNVTFTRNDSNKRRKPGRWGGTPPLARPCLPLEKKTWTNKPPKVINKSTNSCKVSWKQTPRSSKTWPLHWTSMRNRWKKRPEYG